MSFELKESEDNKNYLIGKLEDEKGEEYYYIHDKENGDNWFNASTLSKMFNVPQSSVYRHLDRYTEEKERSNSNSQKWELVLNLSNSSKPVHFYSFDAVTYFAYRTNTDNAIAIRDWINDTLNEKYNQQQGLSKPKLKKPLQKRIKKAVYSKNYKIGKAYSLYHELNNIGYDKSAKMVYHQLKLDEADRDVLREAFTLVDKAEDILKKEEHSTQTKLVE